MHRGHVPAIQKPRSADFFSFDDSAVRAIATAWGMSEVDALYPILIEEETCALLQVRSATSRKALLSQGAPRYFLKEVPWYACSDAQIATSYALQAALAEQRGLGLTPLRTREGRTYFEHGGVRFTLQPLCLGRRFTGELTQIDSAGRALAQLHACAVSLPQAPREDYFALVQAFVDLAKHRSAESRHNHVAMALMTDTLAAARTTAFERGWGTLVNVPVHGDFNPWNLIFDARGDVSAIVDFDNCDVGPALRDLAEATLTFAALRYAQDSTTFARPFSVELVPDAARALFDGYVQGRGASLSPVEWSCMDSVLTAVFIEIAALGTIRGEVDLEHDHAVIEHWLLGRPSISSLVRGHNDEA
jgi:hypothetical protein